jgi:sporulation protein YlmC with PRC-barrel domain
MRARVLLPLTTVFIYCFTLPLLADPNQRDTDAAHATQAVELHRADTILDAEIQDEQGYKLGKVKELALDFQNGRVLEVIMATGGVLGGEEKWFALPPQLLSFTGKKNTLHLGATMGRLQGATEFDGTRWEDSTADARVKEVYQYFGLSSPGGTSGYAGRASKLAGSWVWTTRNEKLGRLETFMVDLPGGRCVEVVLSGKGYNPVPPQSFVWNADNTSLKLNITKDAFKNAPHFSSRQWDQAADPARLAEVYAFYHVDTGVLMAGSNSGAENVRDSVQK